MMKRKKIPSPYVPFIKFRLLNKSNHNDILDLSELPPDFISELSYQRVHMNACNAFNLSLYDDTAILVEYKLMTGFTDVEFSYGYTNGDESPIYSGIVTDYELNLTPGGAELTLIGTSSSAKSFLSKTSASYSGNISDIIKQIAKEEGWEVGNIVETSNNMPNKVYQRNNQSAQQFIANELSQYAVSKNGESGYCLSFEDREGRTIVNYEPISFSVRKESEVKELEFSWGKGDRNSRVLEFSPTFLGTLSILQGGATVEACTVNSQTNEMISVTHTNSDSPSRVTSSNRSIYSYKDNIKNIGGSSYTIDEIKNMANYLWSVNSTTPIQANMKIMGDPLINVLDKISLIVMNKEGIKHHSSGVYVVTEITDSISSGEFTTDLHLIRDTSSLGVADSGGISSSEDLNSNVLNGNTNKDGKDSSTPNNKPNGDIVKVANTQLGVGGG